MRIVGSIERNLAWGRLSKLALCALAVISCSVATGCDREPRHPRAGQIVKPASGGAGGGSNSSEMTKISLYEYSDAHRDVITGQSITFTIPKYFTTNTDNQNGGPQSSINLSFDPVQSRPYIRASYRDESEFTQARSRLVNVMLVGSIIQPRSGDEQAILENGRYPRMPGFMMGPRLKRIDTRYCGFRAFERDDPSMGRQDNMPDRAPRDQRWPFSQGVVLSRSAPNKTHSVITCTRHVELDGYPYCGMNDTYRGWPIYLLFSGSRVCEANEVLSEVEEFLDHYKTRETQRSAGQTEHRY